MNFSFILTEECNWNCSYCEFPLIKNQKSTTMEILKKHLPYVHDFMHDLASKDAVSYVGIQGGEVGLLSLDILRYYFQTIKYVTVVSTNGVFLEKEYHKDEMIRSYIQTIHWHLCPDLYNWKRFDVEYTDDEIPISRGIVHDNLDDIKNFIRVNDHILFDYVEFENDIRDPKSVDTKLYEELYELILPLKNVSEYAKKIIEKRLNEKENHRNSCRDYNYGVTLDMIHETICHCQRDFHNSKPLTKENLIKRVKLYPKDFFDETNCESCTRLYAGKLNGYSIVKGLKARKVI